MIKKFACFICTLSLLPSLVNGQGKETPITSIVGVTVIDVETSKSIDNQTILLQGKQILFVGSDTEKPDVAVDVQINGQGKFAIPGLWDMHIHGFNPNDMKLFPVNGVVGVRMMWGMPHHHQWRKQFESGESLGPQMLIASAIIDGPKPIWPGSIVAKDRTSAIDAVEKAIRSKADFAKVYSLLPRDAYFAIAEKCKAEKLPFDGHVPEMVSAFEASEAGHRSMAHMYGVLLSCSSREEELRKIRSEFVDENNGEVRSLFGGEAPAIMRRAIDSFDADKARKLFQTFKKNGTWQCPTLTVLRNLAYLTEPEVQNDPNLKYISPMLKNFSAPKKPRREKSDAEVQFDRERFQRTLKLVGEMHAAGVGILAGTDVLNPFCFPGFSLHTELELLVKAGLSPGEALKTATINPAKFQNRESEFGTIEAGKAADIVLLNANPLKDIANTKKIDTVIIRGKIMNRKKLDELLSEFEN